MWTLSLLCHDALQLLVACLRSQNLEGRHGQEPTARSERDRCTLTTARTEIRATAAQVVSVVEEQMKFPAYGHATIVYLSAHA